MRRSSHFSHLTRHITFVGFEKESLKEKSLLAGMAAMEQPLMKTMTVLSGVFPQEDLGFGWKTQPVTNEALTESFVQARKMVIV